MWSKLRSIEYGFSAVASTGILFAWANAIYLLPYAVLAPVFPAMRKQGLIDIVGQKGGAGDAGYEYELKPPKGPAGVD